VIDLFVAKVRRKKIILSIFRVNQNESKFITIEARLQVDHFIT
jgi:hypothetical protein